MSTVPSRCKGTPVLEYRAVGKDYRLGDTRITALSEISFSVYPGEFTAIVGPSGSGKSTLLHLGAGLDRPSRGSIHVAGRDIANLGERELARIRNQDMGFIFQTFNLIPVLSVHENIEYPCMLTSKTRAHRSRVGELLALIGITDQAGKRPNMLSGGQRQRVAIARALINNPTIVFADEPTANLDHATGEAIMALLEDLNQRLGTTFLFSTHDPRIMARARRIIRVEDGHLMADGPESES